MSLFGGLIAVILRVSPAPAFVCVLTGTALLGVVSVRLWEIGWHAVGMAIGAYLIWSSVERPVHTFR